MRQKGKYFIGTSGWQYKHWRGKFYPDDLPQSRHFGFYMEHFDTVEINNSFYRLPEKETFKKWYTQAGPDFIFSVKANRFITHMKKLNDAAPAIERMLERTLALKHKLGTILFQLPPNWKINITRFENFLKLLPNGLRYTFEFRNETWYDKQVYQLLEKHNAAFCIYELAEHISPLKITADFVYVRLHGPAGKYSGSYDKHTLNAWARRCEKWLEEGKDVYVYFDNDDSAYAAFNAITLKKMIDKKYALV